MGRKQAWAPGKKGGQHLIPKPVSAWKEGCTEVETKIEAERQGGDHQKKHSLPLTGQNTAYNITNQEPLLASSRYSQQTASI